MPGRRLVLNDGTAIDGGGAGYSDGVLWCWFTGFTLPQTATLFFDSSKTSVIRFDYGEMSETYEGFTNCISLSIDTDGNISVCLKKGA